MPCLFDAALKYRSADPSGRFRDLRVRVAPCGPWSRGVRARGSRSARLGRESPRLARGTLRRIRCAAGQVDSGLDDLEAAVTKLDYPDLGELRKSGDFPHSHPRFRDLTDLRINAVPTGSTVLGNSSGLVEVVNRSRFPLTDVTIRLRYVGSFKPSRIGQMPVEREVTVVETIDRLESTESRPIAFRTDVRRRVRLPWRR